MAECCCLLLLEAEISAVTEELEVARTNLKTAMEADMFPGEYVTIDEVCPCCNGTGSIESKQFFGLLTSVRICQYCKGSGNYKRHAWNGPGNPSEYAKTVLDSINNARQHVHSLATHLNHLENTKKKLQEAGEK